MNLRLSWHLCKRDITGPLKPWIFAWFGVCLLHLGMRLWQTVGGLSLPWLETRWRFDFVLVVVTAALVVPRLIHEESWVDGTATWRARPLARRNVLLARFLFIGSIFVALPALMETFYFAVCGYGEGAMECVLAWLAFTGVWLLPLVGLAVVTRNYRSFVCLVLGISIAILLIYGVYIWLRSPHRSHQILPRFWMFSFANLPLASLLVILMCAAVVGAQIRWRRPLISMAVFVLGTVMITVCLRLPGVGRWIYSPQNEKGSALPEIGGDLTAEIGLLATHSRTEPGEGGVAIRITSAVEPGRAWRNPRFIDYRVGNLDWEGNPGVGISYGFDQGPGWLAPESSPIPTMARVRRHSYSLNRNWEIEKAGAPALGALGFESRFRAVGPNIKMPTSVRATVGIVCHESEAFAEIPLLPNLVWRDGARSLRIVSVRWGTKNAQRRSDQHGDRTELSVAFQWEYPFLVGTSMSRGYPFNLPFSCVLIDGTSELAVPMGVALDFSKAHSYDGHYDASRRIMIQRIIATLYLAPELSSDSNWTRNPKRKLMLLRSNPIAIAKIPVEAPYVYLASPQGAFTKEEDRSAAVEALTYDPDSGESIRNYTIDLLNLMRSNLLSGADAGIEKIAERLRDIADGHVPMLLDLAANCAIGEGGFRQGQEIVNAVAPFIEEEHEGAVIELMTRFSTLDVLPIVRKMGWQESALPAMVEWSSRTSLLPRPWAEFMIESGDRRCYEKLLFHTARGDFGYDGEFSIRLRSLPGFPYERLVELQEHSKSLLGDPLDSEIQKP